MPSIAPDSVPANERISRVRAMVTRHRRRLPQIIIAKLYQSYRRATVDARSGRNQNGVVTRATPRVGPMRLVRSQLSTTDAVAARGPGLLGAGLLVLLGASMWAVLP